MMATRIKIPNGMTIPRMTPKLELEVLAVVGSVAAATSPVKATPPTIGLVLMAAAIPEETELALSDDPAETTASTTDEPFFALLMITLFLVILMDPGAKLALMLSTIH